MTEKSYGKLKFVLKCLEYIMLIAVILECNSLYIAKAEISNYTDMVPFFCHFVLICLIAVILLHFLLYPELLGNVTKYSKVLLLYYLVSIIFFGVNVRKLGSWPQEYYVNRFLVFLPLFLLLFMIKSDKGENLDLVFKHSDIVCVFSAANLLIYLTGVFNLPSIMSESFLTRWSHLGYIYERRVFLNLVEVANGTAWQIADIPLLRNYGVFAEPLMYTIPLVIALSTELFLRSKSDRLRIFKWFLLSVTLVTAQSTMGLMILSTIIVIKVLQTCSGKKRLFMFLPAVLVIVLLVGGLFYEKQSGKYENASGGSTHDHIEDIRGGFRAFLNKPIFGGGFDNEDYIREFIDPEKLEYNKGLSNSGAVILGEGGIWLGLMCMVPFFACFLCFFKKDKRNFALWTIGPFACYLFIIWHFHIFMIFMFAFGYSVMVDLLYGKDALNDNYGSEGLSLCDNETKENHCVPGVLIALGYVMSGAILICFGAPLWSAIKTVLRANQWSMGLSLVKAFYLNVALAVHVILIAGYIKKELRFYNLIVLFVCDAAYLLIYNVIYSVVNTALELKGIWVEKNEALLLFLVWGIVLTLATNITGQIMYKGRKAELNRTIIVTLALFLYFIIYFRVSFQSGIISAQEKIGVIEPVLANAFGKVYVNNNPAFYALADRRISFSGTKDSGFDQCKDTSVIFWKGANYKELFDAGFMVAELSNDLIVYSNDEGVIWGLEQSGYKWYRYYPFTQWVNLTDLANSNGIGQNEWGQLISVSADNGIKNGPYWLLRGSKYTAKYDLHIDPQLISELDDMDTEAARLEISSFNGLNVLSNVVIRASQFNENGDAIIEMPFTANGDVVTESVETHFYPYSGFVFDVRSIAIEETPDILVAKSLDGYGNVIAEEYYNPDGTSRLMSGNYNRIEREYNKKGQIKKIRYYDDAGNRILISAGYSAVEYTHNRQGGITAEKNYGVDDEPILINSGYAECRYEYDDVGNKVKVSYYDTEGNPFCITSGYATVRRKFDEARHIIREEYYDENGDAVTLAGGFSTFENDYDSEGNVTEIRYYGINDEKVLYKDAYWKVKYAYNEKKQVIHEEYYGVDDKLRIQSNGSAGQDKEYDNAGNITRQVFLGVNLKPVIIDGGYAEVRKAYTSTRAAFIEEYYGAEGEKILVNGKYFKVIRDIDDKNHFIHEEYYGTDESPIIISGGYVGCDRIFDENGNIIHCTYLGLDGNPVMTDWGYSIWHREYNDKNQFVKEEYFDTNDEKILLPGGHHSVKYTYDEAGNRNSDSFFGLNDERILVNGNYWKVLRYYNDQKKNIHEEYFGTDGELILISGIYSSVDFTYDKNGNLTKKSFKDMDGNLVDEQIVE